MRKRKQCAVCLTKVQSNIVLKWKRSSDGIVFHVCTLCAEQGVVNAESVQISKLKTYSTVEV